MRTKVRARKNRMSATHSSGSCSGAGNESRTRDLNLGKVALYQLSYSRFADRAQTIAKLAPHRNTSLQLLLLEARLGIEPGYTALQAAA
jgi:hypothetical protein